MNCAVSQMAAACRFTILLLFYGLLYICHWWVIAVSIHFLMLVSVLVYVFKCD